MKHTINNVCFCTILLAFFALIAFTPPDTRVVAMENRSLAELPALNLQTALNGEYARQFEGFIADQVGFRTDLILFSKRIESVYGIALADEPTIVIAHNQEEQAAIEPHAVSGVKPDAGAATGAGTTGIDAETGAKPEPSMSAKPDATPVIEPGERLPVTDPVAGRDDQSSSAATPSGESGVSADRTPGAPPDNKPQPGSESSAENLEPIQAGSLLAFPDKLMEIVRYDDASCIRYADVINGYGADLAGKARVFSLIAPTQIEFADEKYQSVTDSQYDAISLVYGLLENVYPVDAYSRLSAHKKEYIYFRTDHHWTTLGAYYAYLAFAEAAGFEPVTIDRYTVHSVPNFLGYLYSASPSQTLKDKPDTIFFYELTEPIRTSQALHYRPAEGTAPTYRLFLGGDSPLYTIDTSVTNGKTCAIIKDSYANAFVPWLAPHYEHILVIDPRSFSGSVLEMLESYEDVDLILLDYAKVVGLPAFIEYINNIK